MRKKKLYIRKIICSILLTVFAFTQVSVASDITVSCLAVPSYLKPPCLITANGDGTYKVDQVTAKNASVEFMWFVVAEAVEKGMTGGALKNLIKELFPQKKKTGFLATLDIAHLKRVSGSIIIPVKNSNKAFRFFKEEQADKFPDEADNAQRLLLSSGNVVMVGLINDHRPLERVLALHDQQELKEIKAVVRYLWKHHSYLWKDLQALKKVLEQEHGFKLIKTAGKKLLMYSKSKKYIFKVNLEEDYGYKKEKTFFLRDLPVPSTKVLFYHDQSRTLVFNNVTINNDSILFYDYLRNHLVLERQENVKRMMASYAKVLADIHKGKLLAPDHKSKKAFKAQEWISQTERIERRRNSLIGAGYHIVPSLEEFLAAQSRIGEDDIVVTHGDPSPWNCYVDVEEGRVHAVIDTETSTEESRYKDMAKVIIALIDASKNAPHMLDNFENMLTYFFDAYFDQTGIDKEQAFKALPYYLGSQLLWYAEETQRIFSIPAWGQWRLELCQWSLEQESFSIKELINFLSLERDALFPERADKFRISDTSYEHNIYSGGTLVVDAGERVNVELEVTFPTNIEKNISGLHIGVDLWTDMDQEGAWYGISAFELQHVYENKAIFTGYITPKVPGAYDMTAKIVVNNGRPDVWVDNPYGNIKLVVRAPEPKNDADMIWNRAINETYHAVMMDYDGTIKDYNGRLPDEILASCEKMIRNGVHVAINTSRSSPDSSIAFFNSIKERMGDAFRPEYCHIYYGLGYYNMHDGTVEGFQITEEDVASVETILEKIQNSWIKDHIENPHIIGTGDLVGFIFKGNARKDVFARVLNGYLEELNKQLPQDFIAIYSDNYFQIVPSTRTKHFWVRHFSEKTGIPENNIVSIGDQGQRYGVDTAMCISQGGFTVNHDTGSYIYPISVPKYLNIYGVDATVWLLENLKYVPYTQDPNEKIKQDISQEDTSQMNMAKASSLELQEEGFSPDENVWKMDIFSFVPAMFKEIKELVFEAIAKRGLFANSQARCSKYKPKGLVLYADNLVEDAAFLDMEQTLSKGFFKDGGIFQKGVIVLYGTDANCKILKQIIEKSDPSITVFTMEKSGIFSESLEIELVCSNARELARDLSGIQYDFVGLIKGKTDAIMSMSKTAKEINMPIICFDNSQRGVYSFKMALLEAFNRKYGGSSEQWICCLEPVAILSEQTAQAFAQYLLRQREILTKA